MSNARWLTTVQVIEQNLEGKFRVKRNGRMLGVAHVRYVPALGTLGFTANFQARMLAGNTAHRGWLNEIGETLYLQKTGE